MFDIKRKKSNRTELNEVKNSLLFLPHFHSMPSGYVSWWTEHRCFEAYTKWLILDYKWNYTLHNGSVAGFFI